ncbi:hypothetical protein CYY_010396 [Polysphondylium violaceum]|uniref:Uncharacterized protein n=1 Tax=Polysphondylium violaceum TaxID=133409 RepID=A0A8J4UTV6_9MYCE|nr:hypothetical protein CYY_010396 [Polysphondylium violaceum]
MEVDELEDVAINELGSLRLHSHDEEEEETEDIGWEVNSSDESGDSDLSDEDGPAHKKSDLVRCRHLVCNYINRHLEETNKDGTAEILPGLITYANRARHEKYTHPDCISNCLVCERIKIEKELVVDQYTVGQMVAIKNYFNFSNSKYKSFCRLLKLSKKKYSLKEIIKIEERTIKNLSMITKEKPVNTNLYLKISLDGGTYSSTGRKVEIGTLQLIYKEKRSRQALKPHDSYIFLCYFGKERREDIEKHLTKFKTDLMRFLHSNRSFILDVNQKDYRLTPLGVFDLACLEKMLGLYSCFSHNSQFRCFFCKVTNDLLCNFEKETKWSLEI